MIIFPQLQNPDGSVNLASIRISATSPSLLLWSACCRVNTSTHIMGWRLLGSISGEPASVLVCADLSSGGYVTFSAISNDLESQVQSYTRLQCVLTGSMSHIFSTLSLRLVWSVKDRGWKAEERKAFPQLTSSPSLQKEK